MWAKCQEHQNCKWRVQAHKLKDAPGFKVHAYESEHTCAQTSTVTNARSTWLAHKFLNKFKADPERSVKVFIIEFFNELGIHISEDQAYRARKRALYTLEGDPNAQYGILWDYVHELRNRNQGSTIICDVDKETNEFRHYVLFHALK